MTPPRTGPLAFLQEVRDYAIFMIDTEGRVVTWNDGAQAIKGYSADEIIGHGYARFYAADDQAQRKPQMLLDRARSEGRVEDEGWRVRKDGSRFWANVVITAIHDEAGVLVGFVKVTRDLTRRQEAAELLRQSEERLRLLIESLKDYAIFMLDPSGLVSTWNSGAEHIKGYATEEVLGKHFSIFYPPEDVAAGRPARELEIAAREGRYEEEGWRVRKDGGRFWANVIIAAVHDPTTNQLRGFAKVTRDLTERRRMEVDARIAIEQAARERARASEAQHALRARDEFISIVAHELRTPLAALQLKLEAFAHSVRRSSSASRGSEAAAPEERLQGAIRQVDRLTELVERLLDASQIAGGHLVVQADELDLTALVGRVVDDFREPAARAGSELRLHSGDRAVGKWDGARLEQVVMNLLSNATKYGAGKPIDVTVEGGAAGARLIVQDHGIGIGSEDVDRIFGRFERAVPVRHYGGLGLGLYVTRSIVEAHGGSIQVISSAGRGSKFVVDLPPQAPLARSAD